MARSARRKLLASGGTAIAASCIVLAMAYVSAAGPPRRTGDAITVDAVFSPGGGCESRIVQEIAAAEKSVLAQVYLFTSKPISDALIKAKKRGVAVTVILDKSQEKMAYGRWPVMRRGGVQVLFDREHDVANSKIILVDERTVITGSYNFTKAAEEKNAENIVIVQNDEGLARQFKENFDSHLAHSHKASE